MKLLLDINVLLERVDRGLAQLEASPFQQVLRLLGRKDGRGRVPAVELMVNTPTIRECLVEGRTKEIAQFGGLAHVMPIPVLLGVFALLMILTVATGRMFSPSTSISAAVSFSINASFWSGVNTFLSTSTVTSSMSYPFSFASRWLMSSAIWPLGLNSMAS